MFDWLVNKINTSIGQDPNAVSMVGVLDIYGAACLRVPSVDLCSTEQRPFCLSHKVYFTNLL